MKVLIKIFAGLLVVCVLAVIGLLLFVDPNDYKAQIEQQAEQATGRALSIKGDIGYSLIPLGIELPQLELANADGFEAPAFARIDSLVIKVQLIPLLRKELQVDALSLRGLSLFLEVNQDGNNNWQDFAAAKTEAPDKVSPEKTVEEAVGSDSQSSSPLAALAVNGIELSDADIQLDDHSSQQLLQVSGLQLTTGKITFDQAFDVQFKANIAQRQADQQMAADINLKTALTIDHSLQQFSLEKLGIDVKARAPAIHPDPIDLSLLADADIDLASQKVTVSDARVDLMSVQLMLAMTVENWQQQLKVSGNVNSSDIKLRELAYRFATELPAMQDADALTHLEFSSGFTLSDNRLQLAPVALELDESKLDGSIEVALQNTAIRYHLSMDKIDVDNYLPPAPAQDNANANDATQLATAPAVSQPETDLPIPFEALSSLNLKGVFKIGQINVAGHEIKNMEINTQAAKGVIDLSPVKLQVLDGDVEAHTKVDTSKQNLRITQSLHASKLHIAPIADPIVANLMPDQKVSMSGAGDVYADVKTSGMRISSLQKHLSGKAGFNFDDIDADGLDIEYLARGVVSDFLESKKIPTKSEWRGQYRPKNQTAFDVVKADFDIRQGVAHTDNFLMDSNRIDVTGKGQIDIPAQTLDMRTVTDLTPRQLKTTAEKLLDEPLPVRAHGPWAAPQVDVDTKPIQRLAGKMLKDKAKAKAKKKIEKKKQEVKQKAKQKVEDKLKNKLKGLFK